LQHRAEVFGGALHRPNLNLRDVAALAPIVAVILAVGAGARQMLAPFAAAQPPEISLAPAALPNYALRTILRMLLALGISFVFTFTYGTWRTAVAPKWCSFRSSTCSSPCQCLATFHSPRCSSFPSRQTGRWGPNCSDLRYLHEPSLEYGIQFFPIAAHHST
jgi:hypothetical protein